MKAAIVTGATGFVGRWLTRKLLEQNTPVTAVVRPGSGRLDSLPKDERLRVVPCAMGDYALLPELLTVPSDCVFFHLAWEGVSGPTRSDLTTQLKNIAASHAAAAAAVALRCESFVGLGSIMERESAAVADADGTTPGPAYLYGEAKHFAHLATKTEAAKAGMPHLWPILTNAYGEYDDSPRFINATFRRIIEREPLEFTAGTQLYDFIHAEDAARALIAVAERGKPFHSYVIGSGHAAPLRSFVEKIGEQLAPGQELHFGNVPYTGVQLSADDFSIEALVKDTGFVPEISFTDGIRRTMDWMREDYDQ